MRLKHLLPYLVFLFASSIFAQTGPCGTAPNCVVVVWSWAQAAGSGSATGFSILRSTTTGGPYTPVGAVTGTTTQTFTDLSGPGNVLTQGSAYFYVVEASGPGGNSSNGPEAVAKIPFLPPNAPTTTTATGH